VRSDRGRPPAGQTIAGEAAIPEPPSLSTDRVIELTRTRRVSALDLLMRAMTDFALAKYVIVKLRPGISLLCRSSPSAGRSRGHRPLAGFSIEDTMNHCFRMVDLNGTITTIVGTGRKGFPVDGAPADTARLFQPSGMLLMPDGVLYVADSGNNRVRRVVLQGPKAPAISSGGKPRRRLVSVIRRQLEKA
jgi:NHL repeat